MLDSYGIKYEEHFDYEADDIIGSYAKLAEKAGLEVIIISGDKDLTQLASDNITIYYTRRGVTEVDHYTPEFINEKYGLSPEQIIDMKGLMGDKSDNIPGVAGIGEKTAIKLLAEYKTVENVLDNISLDIDRGEFITLLGSSGCGKTTTIRIIAGLETPDSGKVILNGNDITGLAPEKRDVNTVFQNYALFPHMNVEKNIGYGLRLKKMPNNEIKKEVNKALSLVQLEGFEKRNTTQLSGGQRQRVAIARAIVNKPSVLLLDEPLGALDLLLRRQMQAELKKLQKTLGITFIYITHDQEEALNMSSRIVVMRDGKIEQIGTPSEIYDKPVSAFVAEFVGGANLYKDEGKTFAIRSEHIRLGVGEYEGVVIENSFMAGLSKVRVRLKDGQEIISSHMGMNIAINPGEEINIGWDKNDMVEVQGEK